ncbi:MAG: CDP-alcohol phosphatidyltransferase family protein [Anaerolineaceae bacterium]|nr:CDP-alcohol phosphatidyltransferase family protein [Anaerolineaceae bacterium]
MDNSEKKKLSFSDLMRKYFKGILDPIGRFLNNLGLKPNLITILGLVGQMVAALFIAFGEIMWGGLILLVFAPVDALDGTMARLRNEPTRFGGFVDSVTDRYSELIVFAGLLYHFAKIQDTLAIMLVFFAAAGSIMVSYTRARAEALNYDAKIGLLTRLERLVILIPCLIFNIPLVALWILAIVANFTAFQRIYSVRKQAYLAKDVVGLKKR